MNPDVVAAIFVPSAAVLAFALAFRSIREAFAARLRGGGRYGDADEAQLAILAEVRALRSEVYALRVEVAATGFVPGTMPQELQPGDAPPRGVAGH